MRAVSVNVSAASPFGDTRRRVAGMVRWAEEALGSEPPALVLAQECHDDWLAAWRAAGYDVIRGTAEGQPQYKVVSAVIASPELELAPVSLVEVPTLAYHGSYVACARWPVGGEDVLVMSVHASPTKSAGLELWPGEVLEPQARPAGQRADGRMDVYDSDALLATLRHQALRGNLLAAGDLNEALRWDDTHEGHWGRDYFRGVTDAGLVSVLHALAGGVETPSHRDRHGSRYQLDHVIATPRIAKWVTSPKQDPGWAAASDHADWSDHAPIWFELNAPSA
jgi:endonuclease/exonuclease/phosphatase family metal-dependent hydrolase